MPKLAVLLFSLLLLAFPALAMEDGQPPAQAKVPAGYADATSCKGCHTQQSQQWQGSDHAWAMREASEQSVLGDFAERTFDDAGTHARFFRKGGGYYVTIEGEDGKPADFPIRYTFGHYPLQQYLVAFPNGRLQALTIAWDSRPKEAGGQRWYSLYPGQRFAPGDPLHWTGRYQNWNAMCADCHSSGLLKHYDDKRDTFATTWHEQNVGCQGCHGPAQAHVDWAKKAGAGSHQYAKAMDVSLQVDFKALGSKGLVEQCAFCHSRRQTMGLGQQPGHPQLDASLPALLRTGLYHPDGQIDGEVYEFGSFAQSKMYAAGVTCTDCHNPHSLQLKIEGNGLCQQCHNPQPPARFPSLQAKNYDSPEHHHHATGSAGAQCVNCHMATKTYMGVDVRRDHDFRLPRPDLNASTGSPDACTACHQDKQPAWAAKAIEGWFGQPQRPPHYGQTFHAVRSGDADSVKLLGAVIADLGKPEIVRSSAVEQLADLGEPALPTLRRALGDDSALVRAYAIPGLASLPAQERLAQLLPLLQDPNRAVRDEALRGLADIPASALPLARREHFKAQMGDYESRLRGNADLPGGRLNLAVLLERQGRRSEALEEYRQALRLDPYFAPARVNLVNLAMAEQRPDEAEATLREGLALTKMPESDHGNLAYMLALLLVEREQAGEALDWLAVAARELPGNPRVFYNQSLLLARQQRPYEALDAVRKGLAMAPDDADLLYAQIYLQASNGQLPAARNTLRHLARVAPNDPRVAALAQQLGGL